MKFHVAQLVSILASRPDPTRPTFAAFLYQPKGGGPVLVPEVQHVTVLLGASTANLYARDIEELERTVGDMVGLTKRAAEDILKSRHQSLAKGIGNNPRYTQAGMWTDVLATVGQVDFTFPGLRRRIGTALEIQVTGLLHHKSVVVPGKFRTVNSEPFTIERNKILRSLPSGRFRSYSLSNIAGVRLNGETVEFDNVITRR